ncbi:UDP-3-O-acylglucosamine N-acyltransferase [Azorhizobium oxalatiphilum]|uniref:UDP-3-O-acylglucosamine N-acyltransferase n=1 Tax=Azorhizobium oxalatiphilum TaxID=980631 RepID=A0A917CCC7_9HYPH|nr:UDP-3-O-(3-hydroxymyristoyl)glucosamine N-acyltransferase [Azorhizobium oxalatiphilum]GGF83899.1 UDP-3-O-acylglucosamine N-acyltransferase [Azorhizobium oxalatiphilum]
MTEPAFFPLPSPLSLAEVATLSGARLARAGASADLEVRGVGTLADAGPHDLAFFDSPRYLGDFRASRAGACITNEKLASEAPEGMAVFIAGRPAQAFVSVTRALFPQALRPQPVFGHAGIATGAFIHPTARLEDGVTVDPGAVIGPGTEIGSGTVICANAVIGAGVRIGRDCAVGPGATLTHTLLGNRVIIHAGARLGQDGFGYQPGAAHLKVPQIGRVVVQDDVEIGANTAIDRGALRDTVIGEGTKIDNLVQIAHNVVIGRHCIIVSQTGISGSTTLEDYVVLGGQVGVVGHCTIGTGSQIAASSNVKGDVPPGVRWGGSPAKPVREWFREITTLKNLAAAGARSGAATPGDEE